MEKIKNFFKKLKSDKISFYSTLNILLFIILFLVGITIDDKHKNFVYLYVFSMFLIYTSERIKNELFDPNNSFKNSIWTIAYMLAIIFIAYNYAPLYTLFFIVLGLIVDFFAPDLKKFLDKKFEIEIADSAKNAICKIFLESFSDHYFNKNKGITSLSIKIDEQPEKNIKVLIMSEKLYNEKIKKIEDKLQSTENSQTENSEKENKNES